MSAKQPKNAKAIVWTVVLVVVVFGLSAAITTYLMNRGKTDISSGGGKAQVSMEPVPTAPVVRKFTIFLPKATSNSFYLVGQQVESDKPGNEVDVTLDVFLEEGQKPIDSLELIPKGTKRLKPVVVDKGIATIDLSSEFVDGFSGGAEQESLTLNSIAHTLAACKESKIDKVRILVNGKSVESLGGHLDMTEPIEPLTDVLKPGG